MSQASVSLVSGFALALWALACSGTSTPSNASPAAPDDAGEVTVSTDAGDGTTLSDAALGTGSPTPTSDAGPVIVSDAGAATLDSGATADAGAKSATAHVAIPMYVDPASSPSLWSEVHSAGAAAGLLVMNPDNGPDPSADSQYTTVISNAHAAGQIVIGYVHSQSAQRAIADVEADVDTYYSQYPAMDGIFVDEVSDQTSTVATYYVPLYTHIKAKGKSVTVVINPGTMVDESFMTATDILLSWEDTYADYINPKENPGPPAWVKTYPAARFWNIIHTTPAANEADAIARAKAANVGWVYVTAEGPDTAYQNIETGTYWTTELSLVTGP